MFEKSVKTASRKYDMDVHAATLKVARQFDPFRPNRPLPRVVYDAFQKEAEKRNIDKSSLLWIKDERQAVYKAAKRYCKENGLPVLSLKEIEEAEQFAVGSADYGAKWAYKIERIVDEKLKEIIDNERNS